MDFTSLSLDLQDTYRTLFSMTPEKSSDYSFVTLWGWHAFARYEIAMAYGLAWLRVSPAGTPQWCSPVGNWHTVDWEEVLRKEFPEGATFERVPKALATLLSRTLPNRIEMEPQRPEWEYVYSVREMVELSGNRYHKKKNLLSQFLKYPDWSFEPLVAEKIPEVLAMQADWCAWKNCMGSPVLAAENEAILRVLGSWSDLSGLKGGILRVGNRIVAYTVAEALTEDTLVIHFEKGDTEYKGAYQAINQVFLECMGAGFSWVNREQDAGEQGLRQAKMSYHPAHFVEKYRIRYLGGN
jgi:hypothetical protein